MNNNIAVLGAQLGDEAKARVCHWFAKDYDWVCRFGGGANAGHTLYHNGTKIIRHQLPSADFSVNNKAFLGSGMVINLEELLIEIQETERLFPGSAKRVFIDPDAFVVLDKHLQADRENVARIGSTGRGITPCYIDAIGRTGVKISAPLRDNSEITNTIQKTGAQFKYASELMEDFRQSRIIFEGSQSVLLEIPFGAYPYVSSGQCSLGGICNAGFASLLPTKVFGVLKGYTTCVGNMPFPTEYKGEEAERLQTKGQERGSTTGRLRRCGALDLPALRYAIQKGGINQLIVSKLDVLEGQGRIKVCLDYGQGDPQSGSDFFNATPLMSEVDGWNNVSTDQTALDFLAFIEKHTDCKISHYSYGVNEDQMKERK
jgi:adenylosuccinate synthase